MKWRFKLLTTAASHECILVFVDRLSKMVRFVAVSERLNAPRNAMHFVHAMHQGQASCGHADAHAFQAGVKLRSHARKIRRIIA